MSAKNESASNIEVVESSGNVFADLGLPNAEQELMKAELTLRIYQMIQAKAQSPE